MQGQQLKCLQDLPQRAAVAAGSLFQRSPAREGANGRDLQHGQHLEGRRREHHQHAQGPRDLENGQRARGVDATAQPGPPAI